MKSVCLVVQNSYPSDVRIRKYAQTLTATGHKVSVIACRMPGQLRHETIDGAEVFRIPPGRTRAGKLRYLLEYVAFLVLAFIQLNILDFKRKFDIIHLNTLPDFLVFCAIVQKLAGRTIILDMHEVMPEFFMSKYSKSRESRIVKALMIAEKLSMQFADQIITVNHALKRLFESRVMLKRPVIVIMNTVDGNVMKRWEKRKHDSFNCVYHGTLTEIYGVDSAIEGFAKACRNKPALFHIFGEGPQLPELKRLAESLGIGRQVIFHGSVPHEQIWKMLAEMDIGILDCRKDVFTDLSFSNKLAEYVYLKIPVIHSDLASIQYYFSDKEIVFCKSKDVDNLAAKIVYAMEHPEEIGNKAEAAHLKYFDIDWSVMSRRYLRIIEETGAAQNETPGGAGASAAFLNASKEVD